MSIIKIGDGFKLPHFDPEDYRNLPVSIRKHGDEWSEIKTLEWMQYNVPGEGVIAFAKKLNEYRPEIVRHTIEYLNRLIDIDIPERKISILKTFGSITPHCDEGRISTINIGLLDSHKGITRAGNSRDPIDFFMNRTSVRVQEGCCYLLNTGALHSVDADEKGTERYLISVSFGATFGDLVKRLK